VSWYLGDIVVTTQKFALIYPPEFDGELHILVESEKNKPFMTRKISLTISCDPGESVEDAIRRVGREIAQQPLRTRAV
jgi:hypothetical protein